MKLWIFFFVWEFTSINSFPSPMRVVDLTHVFNNDTIHYPNQKEFQIQLVRNGTFADKYWLQFENYETAIHVGTHIDAPCHVIEGGLTVDKIPWDRLVARAAVVNIEKKAEQDPDYSVTIDDLKGWELQAGQRLNKVILLIRSGWSKKYGNRDMFLGSAGDDPEQFHYPGISLEAAQWLVNERNIYGYGIESISLDRGKKTNLPVHTTLLGANIYGLEMITNVDQLPMRGAMLHVMPMKIGNGSGAPSRVLAFVPAI